MSQPRFLVDDIIEILRKTHDNDEIIEFFSTFLNYQLKSINLISFNTYSLLKDLTTIKIETKNNIFFHDVIYTASNLLFLNYYIHDKVITGEVSDIYERGMEIIKGYSLYTLLFPILDRFLSDKHVLMDVFVIYNDFYMKINDKDYSVQNVKEMLENEIITSIQKLVTTN